MKAFVLNTEEVLYQRVVWTERMPFPPSLCVEALMNLVGLFGE